MRTLLPLCASILLAGCSLFGSVATNETGTSSESSYTTETQNVSYVGIVTRVNLGMAAEGTHVLTLDDGKAVLLESQLLTLNDYIGKQIVVFGTVRPTMSGNGIIMRVDSVSIMTESSSSSLPSTSSSSENSSSLSASSAAPSSESIAASSQKSTTATSAAPKSAAAIVSSVARSSVATVSSAAGVSADINATVKAMVKADTSAEKWTQQYCSSHIGFCVPIHKNWYYASFGTTGSALWHVEIGNNKIENLGDGQIIINLMTGTSASKGITDGTVQPQGDFVVAFKNWKDNMHFEISAPAALKSSVTFMSQSITAYQIAQ